MIPAIQSPKTLFSIFQAIGILLCGIVLFVVAFIFIATDTGRVWKMHMFGTYQPTQATMSEFSVESTRSGKTSASASGSRLYFTGNYMVGTQEYTGKVLYKEFYTFPDPSPADYIESLTKEYVGTEKKIQIYYNPSHPTEAVTRPEDEPHNLFLVFNIIFMFCSFILITMGVMGLKSKWVKELFS